jgi:hypothetical protein
MPPVPHSISRVYSLLQRLRSLRHQVWYGISERVRRARGAFHETPARELPACPRTGTENSCVAQPLPGAVRAADERRHQRNQPRVPRHPRPGVGRMRAHPTRRRSSGSTAACGRRESSSCSITARAEAVLAQRKRVRYCAGFVHRNRTRTHLPRRRCLERPTFQPRDPLLLRRRPPGSRAAGQRHRLAIFVLINNLLYHRCRLVNFYLVRFWSPRRSGVNGHNPQSRFLRSRWLAFRFNLSCWHA